ncbi:SMI1/KNR4 family protein [Streptomyces sp. NPDC091972]|uniref:SMI1/KNR4 family protein n=1 Tax=Streptomyces sp. NPDC091972 TaxID=3366007 RepID=UPI003810A50E
MDYSEFATLLEQVRSDHPFWFGNFKGWRASEEEIVEIEANFRVVFPVAYRRFMATVGGGEFGFLDIFPLSQRQGSVEDFQSVNSERWWDDNFLAFSPVGTGDLWGFMVEDGVCLDRVTLLDHETAELVSEDQKFLEFLAAKALKP